MGWWLWIMAWFVLLLFVVFELFVVWFFRIWNAGMGEGNFKF